MQCIVLENLVYFGHFFVFSVLCIFDRFRVAAVINGRAMAKHIKDELRAEVKQWVSEGHRPPHLTAILVGTAAPSDTYVRNKMKAADYIGLVLQFFFKFFFSKVKKISIVI